MRRSIYIFIILLLFILTGQIVHATDAYQWSDIIYYDIFDDFILYSLAHYNLNLPGEERESFSIKSLNELHNLALLYGTGDNEGFTQLNITTDELKNYYIEDAFRLDEQIEETKQEEAVLSFNPLPGVLVNADFEESREDLELETNANVSLEYQLNNRTMIRAEYDLVNRKWWDLRRISLNDDEAEPELAEELFFSTEKTNQSRLGISFQTSDKMVITADYVDAIFDHDQDFTTILGVEYSDDVGTVKYQYEFGFGESRQMVSGLELGIKDLATFNATYKLLNKDQLADQLREKESTWDFGVDFNLNERSSFSLGYQVKSNESADEELTLIDPELMEKNIKAQLEFKF